ncbi:sensor histidine kinase [Streptosporangium carneum]|uniref:histidine kinase n=1 Tax=Streptosporangium carneum TaxID=47481 RepID=A0A9W6HX84_9ACTN|nr:sensor histidine kinase [Streptosporangium carneum]GLK08012.1 two-component sensor histidine kinase [Streptosporangium carneum]
MLGRLHSWTRRHPGVVDALLLTPFLVLSVMNASFVASQGGTQIRTTPWGGVEVGVWGVIALGLMLSLPLLWARRHPLTVFGIVSLVSFCQWLLGVQPLLFNAAVLVAMYMVASRRTLRWAVAACLTAELGLALSFGQIITTPDFSSWASVSVFVVAIWITGIYANTRRRYLESLEERAERAEHERDQQARLAAAAERARIARELHDVVAHNVSVIIVQADGAGYAIDSDPEQAREAIRAISHTGRQALAEMRRMVGVLRADGVPEEYAPQPSLSQMSDLVAQVRSSGLPVDFRVTGLPQDLPEGEQLTVYRIVQEALTNTLKHGGPDSRATVEMEYGARELLLRVTDDGRGAAAPRSPDGHGLVGMRERVAVFGGSVEARPRPGGGFQVTARLPIGEAGQSRAA